MKDKLLKKLKKDIANNSIYFMAKKIDIPYATLWRIQNGKYCNMRTWLKIESYYS